MEERRLRNSSSDSLLKVLIIISFTCSLWKHRLFSICQIDHNRITRPDQIFRCDHDLLAPLSRTRAEAGFIYETRLEEGSESNGLPAKGGDRTDYISCCLFHYFRRSHLDIA